MVYQQQHKKPGRERRTKDCPGKTANRPGIAEEKRLALKPQAFLQQIREKIAALSISVPLATIATHYNLKYISESKISEDEFLALEDIGIDAGQRQIYRILAAGKISPIIAAENDGFFYGTSA